MVQMHLCSIDDIKVNILGNKETNEPELVIIQFNDVLKWELNYEDFVFLKSSLSQVKLPKTDGK